MDYPALLAVHLSAGLVLENNAPWLRVLLDSLKPLEYKGLTGYVGTHLQSLDPMRAGLSSDPWLVVCLEGERVTTLGKGHAIEGGLWLPLIRHHHCRSPLHQILLPIL